MLAFAFVPTTVITFLSLFCGLPSLLSKLKVRSKLRSIFFYDASLISLIVVEFSSDFRLISEFCFNNMDKRSPIF